MRVAWSRPALDDLSTINDYPNQHDARAAAKALRAIRAKGLLLQHFPALGQALNPAMRRVNVAGTPNIIVYEIGPDRISVLRLFDSRKNWQHQIDEP